MRGRLPVCADHGHRLGSPRSGRPAARPGPGDPRRGGAAGGGPDPGAAPRGGTTPPPPPRAIAANAMFARASVSLSTKHRASAAHLLAEAIATSGLVLVIFALARTRRTATAPAAVGAYIGAAYFFTSSTSFANPAVSMGRMF